MKALAIGGGDTLWSDLKALGGWTPHIVVACNDGAVSYPGRVDHFATLHPKKLKEDPEHPQGWGWIRQRQERGGNTDFVTWTHAERAGLADRAISGWTNGSSGMLCVGVALELGAKVVVCAGVPMTLAPHYFDNQPWEAADKHFPKWRDRLDTMRGRVFSMSGRTRELLGAPPWITSELGQ